MMSPSRRNFWRRAVRTALAATLSAGLLAGAVSLYAAQSQSPPKKADPPKAPAKNTAPAKSKSQPSKVKATTSRARRSRTQQAPTADRIKEIQAALAKAGHYNGEPTGKLDAKTVEAIKAYQQANDIAPTGKLDARTLQKLGLGSDVAGSAPPRAAKTSPDHP